MKVGIVGAGAVGTACLFAMALRASAREIVLVNRNRAKARGAVTDLQYALALGPAVSIRDGDYDDLRGAGIVAITVGANEKSGGATNRHDPAGRLRLLDTNAQVYREVVPRIAQAAPDAVLVVVTDPPDALADVARGLCRGNAVVSTGTYLDSLRLRFHIARKLGVDARSVDAMVLGEHGTSQVYAWSAARVAGTPVIPNLLPKGQDAPSFRQEIEDAVRYANINIIEGTGASQLGIGVVTARIVEAIARDEKVVIPLGSCQRRYNVTLSLPSRVGRRGVEQVLEPALSDEEWAALEASAQAIRKALERVAKRPAS
jgi:L-lactate dehydrogenase